MFRLLALTLIFLALQGNAVFALGAGRDAQLKIAQADTDEYEPPPPPEAPYPGAPQSTDEPRQSQPAKPSGSWNNTRPELRPDPVIERPKRINEDGDYIYETKSTEPPSYSGREGIEPPKGTSPSGEYIYDKEVKKPEFSGRDGIEAPVLTTSSGEYRYKTESHEASKSASFHLGVMTPPKITNSSNNLSFQTVYGGGPSPILLADYEFYHRKTPVGRFGLKFGSGLTVYSRGQGQWKTPRAAGSTLPFETFTFAMLPNTLTAIYKFQWADQQWVVPYVEGGPGYFTFVEVRSDGKRIAGGGSPVLVGAAGLNFLIDKFDPKSIRELDLQYGINHLWFSLEVRPILGLESSVNFTSVAIVAGFVMEF